MVANAGAQSRAALWAGRFRACPISRAFLFRRLCDSMGGGAFGQRPWHAQAQIGQTLFAFSYLPRFIYGVAESEPARNVGAERQLRTPVARSGSLSTPHSTVTFSRQPCALCRPGMTLQLFLPQLVEDMWFVLASSRVLCPLHSLRNAAPLSDDPGSFLVLRHCGVSTPSAHATLSHTLWLWKEEEVNIQRTVMKLRG